MIHRAGAGPAPIPHKKLNAHKLRDAINFALRPEAKAAAANMADGIRHEVCVCIAFGFVSSDGRVSEWCATWAGVILQALALVEHAVAI
jgi:hypothetical protein